MKIWTSKREFNDIAIISIILFIFLGTAVVLPFLDREFGDTETKFSTEGVGNNLIGSDINNVNDIKVFDVIKSVGKVFFWSFGTLPFFLELIFTVLRIILLLTLIKNYVPFLG